jgi:Holliday junction DNA helicase RuvA
VREDAETLFGFFTADERDVFRALTKVSGVGPKLALAALSAMPPDELRQYVVSGDISLLTRIPGVGRKTAERMIVELRDKLVPTAASIVEGSAKGATGAAGSPSLPVARMDAILALEALGMSRGAAEKAVAVAMRASPTAVTAEELIRLALRS